MNRAFFISASGTGIGKTLVTAALNWQLRQSGKNSRCLKPVISGYDADDAGSDTAVLLDSMEQPHAQSAIDTLSPWRFSAPLSPDMAAAREGRVIELPTLADYCRKQAAGADYLLAEGVGGVMAPLNNRHTVLDWMEALRWPVILVGGSYLGALSHTLSAVAVLRERGVPIQALVISESEGSMVALEATRATLENFLPPQFPLVTLPRLRATTEPWKHAPSLSWICDHEI